MSLENPIVTDEPHNVGDPFSSVVISIKSMEGLPARAEIDVRYCRVTRRRSELKSSIRRRDRPRITGEWALDRQDGFFGTDSRTEHLTRDFLLSLMNANLPEDRPTMHEIRKRYVIETFYEVGREFQVAKALNMDYRTVSVILRKEKLLQPEVGDNADTPLFPDIGSDPLNQQVE